MTSGAGISFPSEPVLHSPLGKQGKSTLATVIDGDGRDPARLAASPSQPPHRLAAS